MNIPDLNNLIKAIECDSWVHGGCEYCPYNYQYLDDRGDTTNWFCDEEQVMEDSLFYLKLYQKLIEEQNNDSV